MAKRSYDQFCGLARALDVVGERWTLLLVRDLSLGPQRYSDLLAGLPGIGTSMLAERLKHLEDEGLVRRVVLPPPAGVTAYELTEAGEELVGAIAPLALWGSSRLGSDEAGTHRPEWMFFALRTRFRAEFAAGVRDTYEFRVDGATLHARIDDGAIEVGRGPAPGRADLVVEADARTLLDLALRRVTAADAVAAGRAVIAGSPEAAARCQRIFGSDDPVAEPQGAA